MNNAEKIAELENKYIEMFGNLDDISTWDKRDDEIITILEECINAKKSWKKLHPIKNLIEWFKINVLDIDY